ncbi:MAG: cytochrome c3 family protein [Planctomycetota bacterium]
MPRCRPAGIVAGLVALLLAISAAYSQDTTLRRYIATSQQVFELAGQEALFMPTAVTVGPDGAVFVVDGVNDRIVKFNADGTLAGIIDSVGDEQLSTPVSAKADAGGRLWIADTGHQRVLVRAPDGTLERVITMPADLAQPPPDFTDVSLGPDGATLWLADNDRHRLWRYNLATADARIIGRRGESLGEFQYPFMLAVAANGDVALTDVINGRVQVLTGRGTPTATIGTYGVGIGQLYRPKGLAIDGDNNIWVADGVLNVVQVFSASGRLLDVLGDAHGGLFRFDHPMGLAFDATGFLYVVELGANRVRKLRVAETATPSPRVETRRGRATIGQQARACTVCHMEWLAPLVNHQPTTLIDVPPNPANHPHVSRSEVCLSCHDGSVGDSRRRVWVRHGHRIGIEPPPSIDVPAHLPLADGRIACRTCHSAHGLFEPRTTFEEIVFLRVASEPSELCVQCHTDLTTGPVTGTHPLGTMPQPVPAQLIDAGAIIGPDKHGLNCLVCHEGHGSQGDLMLVVGTSHNELCLTCHEQMRPGMFREHEVPPHPAGPKLSTEQAAAVQDAGAKLGPEGELICLSCHQMHHAKSNRYILAFDDVQSGVCLRCHQDKQVVFGSSHDLRTNFPDEVNTHGATVTESGPCGACHLFHNYARPLEAHPIDPRGQCITCHQPDRCAESKILGPVNHSKEQCVACHDPHNARQGKYLSAPASELCASCHQQQAGLVHGPHDLMHPKDKSAWPQTAAATKDTCLACHRPHGTDQTGLFRVAPDKSVTGPDAVCLACHADTKPGADSKKAVVHPRVVKEALPQDKLPLVETADGQHQIACATCHDPHRGPDSVPHLLRGADLTTAEELCLTCHPQLASVHTIGEAKASLQTTGFKAEACKPCHVVHANPQEVESRFLWPKKLSQFEWPTTSASIADVYCVACHRAGGPVPPPEVASHPDVLMYNPNIAGTPGYFPLFNKQGTIDPRGMITCRTCHLTHGRSTPAPVPLHLRNIQGRELRARKWHIRIFGATTVCNTCHGFDALRRFMYFHDPARRSGPIDADNNQLPP